MEDDEILRESIPMLLREDGYEVSLANDGSDALTRLRAEDRLPDMILLDLRMPVMDGWEFRTHQVNDPRLSPIPVLAVSGDGSGQAAAISADAFLRKPVGATELLSTVGRVLGENKRRTAARMNETERLASLGRLAAGVGHEINNPLAFLMLNLGQALESLRLLMTKIAPPSAGEPLRSPQQLEIEAGITGVIEMLEDSLIGGQRIRGTVNHLQQLSRQDEAQRGPVDLHAIIEQSVSMVWTQIRHRARLIKIFGNIPLVLGDATSLGQVFLNLLVNASQAMSEGDAPRNEIRVSTSLVSGPSGSEVLVEISDTGQGIDGERLSQVFEPFFTTKAVGQGTGLGLSISRQTVTDHGGRLTVESVPGKGTTFRTYLPVAPVPEAAQSVVPASKEVAARAGRILVIDDEPLIGRVIQTSLKADHEVIVVETVRDAVARLERSQKFDLILCDVVMPDVSGPEFYSVLADRWPHLLERLVFMTGGAFTPLTSAFLDTLASEVLSKPFSIERLKTIVRERTSGAA